MTKQMMVLIAIIAYVFVRGFFIEPNALEVNTYKIEDPNLQGVKVAFLSDLHLGKTDFKKLNKIIALTNQQNADIVIFGGGYGLKDKSKSMKPDVLSSKLNQIKGQKFAVLGADDWKGYGSDYAKAFYANNINFLENRNVRKVARGKFFDIIGIADIETEKANIAASFMMTTMPRIVVTHNPDIYYDIMDDASIILAGHTHGGQFILPFTPPLFVPSKFGTEFASGLVHPRQNKIIISKGIGTNSIPVRFNCKPEIVIVEFVPYGMAK